MNLNVRHYHTEAVYFLLPAHQVVFLENHPEMETDRKEKVGAW
jgi:hypothetical protein